MQKERKIFQMSHEERKLYKEQLIRELGLVNFYLQKTAPTGKRFRVEKMPEERKISKMSFEERKLYKRQLIRELERVNFYLQKTAPTHKRIRVKGHK